MFWVFLWEKTTYQVEVHVPGCEEVPPDVIVLLCALPPTPPRGLFFKSDRFKKRFFDGNSMVQIQFFPHPDSDSENA